MSHPATPGEPLGHDAAEGRRATEPRPIDRRGFLVGAGGVAGSAVLAAVVPSGSAGAATPPGASRFVPLPAAVRVADTRDPARFPFSRVHPMRIRVPIAGDHGVPVGASAVVLTVTAVNGDSPNFVTVFPTSGAVPVVSNLNLAGTGDVTANLVTVKLGAGGAIDVYSLAACSMIVDVLGYYQPVGGPVRAGRFVPLSAALRVIDTRPNHAGSSSFTEVDLTAFVPADASSAVINLTATESTGPGFFTALPFDAPEDRIPSTSSLNVSRPGETRAAGVIVPVTTVGGRRRIKVFTLQPAKLVVDVGGYFTSEVSASSSDGLFVPVDPVRLVDTRIPGGEVGKLWPEWVVEVRPPASILPVASAVVANVTGVDTRGAGFLTVTAARRPISFTSNVNFSGPRQIVPNHVITPVTDTHGLQVYSSHGAHVLVDLAGYYTGRPKAATMARWPNPAPPAAPPQWVLRVPRIGLTSTVQSGSATAITNSGRSWHWTGTGFMGQEGANVALFAHRTDAGGPYRNIHWLQTGDELTVTTGDFREYTYRVVRRDLTDSANANILAATRYHPGTTLSLVACTVGHDRTKSRWPDVWAPTSLKYRIVVTAELVSWREY